MTTLYARMQNGIVAEVLTLSTGAVLADTFHADLVTALKPCDPAVKVGMALTGETFAFAPSPPVSAEDLGTYAGRKLTALTALARPYALGGSTTVTCDGTSGTIAHLLALQQWGTANPTQLRNWIDNAGVVTSLTGAQFVTLAQAVGPYALSVFDAYGTVLSGIRARSLATYQQIDAATWPV